MNSSQGDAITDVGSSSSFSLDNTDDDPTYDPNSAKKKKLAAKRKLQKNARRRGAANLHKSGSSSSEQQPSTSACVRTRRQRVARTRATATTNCSRASEGNSSESGCEQQPRSSRVARQEKEFLDELAKLKGAPRKRRIVVTTTFLKDIEKEPFRFGISDLLADFCWTEQEPKHRADFFQPVNPAGDVFQGDELPVEIFLSFHGPALKLVLKAVNETGAELVEKGRLKSFKPVDWEEVLRFHSILLYTQVVKISRLDTYWRKQSIANQSFVASQMSFKRFKLIKRCIRCYVPSEVRESGLNNPKSNCYDRLYKISPLQNLLLQTYRAHRYPTREVTIDEMMVKFKVRLRKTYV